MDLYTTRVWLVGPCPPSAPRRPGSTTTPGDGMPASHTSHVLATACSRVRQGWVPVSGLLIEAAARGCGLVASLPTQANRSATEFRAVRRSARARVVWARDDGRWSSVRCVPGVARTECVGGSGLREVGSGGGGKGVWRGRDYAPACAGPTGPRLQLQFRPRADPPPHSAQLLVTAHTFTMCAGLSINDL